MARSTTIVAGGNAQGGSKDSAKRKIGKETPMMEQFWRAKKEQPDALLFFRMGDFYELFHEDAKIASRELGITLTARSKGADAIAMAGVPVKAAEGYLLRLVQKGHKVAICEQLQDPRKTKGIVDRGIVRVVTPGTITEETILDAAENNFLAAVHISGVAAGIAWVDLSTGRFRVAEVAMARLQDELTRVSPAELLLSTDVVDDQPELHADLAAELGPRITARDPWRFDRDAAAKQLCKHFHVKTLEGFGIQSDSPAVPAAGCLVEYLEETQKNACQHIQSLELVQTADHLLLDRATRSTLELVLTQRDGRKDGTLLAAIDRSLTPMGRRMTREWLLAPLRDVEAIRNRQAGVAEFHVGHALRDATRADLAEIRDLERLSAKIATARANGRDLAALATSLHPVAPLAERLAPCGSDALKTLAADLDPLDDLIARIESTLAEELPLTIKEGGLIRCGFDPALDELRSIARDGKSWMVQFQATEAERTGITNLKIGYNSVFGYFLEVPRGQVERVPEEWIRKQTIKTAERYITPELKEFETKVVNSEDRSKDIEYDLFCALRDEVATQLGRILSTARAVATTDTLCGLAQLAADERYIQPTIDDSGNLSITEGRHPVLEQSLGTASFVPNDTNMDAEGRLISILTGPNMSGKSTWIRQTALIVLLAQIGSFVPAAEARIGVVDRIFTRIGSADDIGHGSSTFMVEMVEIANILNNATERSLVVLDEVGRGTSTFDGLALAWAIVEHLHQNTHCRTLFATHYHQLTDLSETLPGVTNLNVAVRERADEILFLHKIVEGGTDRSYGIHVARLAGVPAELLDRAKTLLTELEAEASGISPTTLRRPNSSQQLGLFAPSTPSPISEALANLDPDHLTPMEALIQLHELKRLSQGEGQVEGE
jgi:DNA mismatch repair protein MutS